MEWLKTGTLDVPWANLPRDGSEFLVMHPDWISPAVVCYDSHIDQFIYSDENLWRDSEQEMILDDFTNLIFCRIPDFPKWWWDEMDESES